MDESKDKGVHRSPRPRPHFCKSVDHIVLIAIGIQSPQNENAQERELFHVMIDNIATIKRKCVKGGGRKRDLSIGTDTRLVGLWETNWRSELPFLNLISG